MKYLEKVGLNARKAFEELKAIKHNKIKLVLKNYNTAILKNKKKIIKENLKDVKNVKRKHLIDRLILNDRRIDRIRHSINEIAKFKNPIGRVLEKWQRPNKLKIKKVSTPIGVIGVIYESRPNVTADVAALCLKSGNCSILRGGSESYNSNKLLANLFRESLDKNNIDKNCVQFIEKKERKIVDSLLSKMSSYIDVIVPRGGRGLVEKVKKFSGFAGLSNVPFKIIILDEADEMTADAQTALRRIIEDTAKICRFILIANNVSKIIDPIQSRCATFKFTSVGEEDIISRLEVIAKKEKVKSNKKGLKAIYDYSQGDLRHAINLLQATASLGEISEETVTSSAGLTKTTDVDDVLKIALSGNVVDSREKMIELIKVYGMSESDFLKYFNSAVFKSKHEKLAEILEVIAKYDYRILVGANSEIQLSAMLAEIARIEK